MDSQVEGGNYVMKGGDTDNLKSMSSGMRIPAIDSISSICKQDGQ